MQSLVALLRRVRERPPSDSASAPSTAGASERREKGRGGLHSAAARGDLARLQQRWWRKRFYINSRDANKQTPLHLACANGHADVVRFLARKRCQLNPRGMFKKTPLMLAVEHEHKDCVTALLEHGANPDHKGAGGNTALHMAAIMPSKAMVELLLQHKAHIEAKNELGYTPLAVAILKCHEEMVEFLIQKGADVHARDRLERTTLVIAAYAGNVNVVQLLLQHGVDIFHRDKCGLHVMSFRHQFEPEVTKTLEEYARSKRTGECSVAGAGGPAVPEISSSGKTAAPPVGAPAQIGAGVLPEAGAQQGEELDSLSDSDVTSLETDSEGPEEVSAVVLLHAAKQPGACAQPVAEERHNGVLTAAGAAQEEDFDFSSLDEVSALEREELPLKKEASSQTDGQGDTQGCITWLQQELASALRRCSTAEASLEAEKRYSRDLQEQKVQLQKELDSSKARLQELQEQLIRTECYAEALENDIKNKERELTASKNLQSLLVTSSGTAVIPQLEEYVQQLQVGMARLEATARQQDKTMEALQQDLRASASVTNAVSMASQLADFQRTGGAVATTHAAGKINPGPVRSVPALPGTQEEPVQNLGLASEVFWDSLVNAEPPAPLARRRCQSRGSAGARKESGHKREE